VAGTYGNGGTTAESPTRALETLFEQHSGRVYAYCLRRLGSVQEAEDALQVTYLNAWRSLVVGTKPEEPTAWLLAIAANVCSSDLRSTLRRGTVELRPPADLEEVGAEPVDGDELFGLTAAVAALPDRQRRALVLRDWRGLSYQEIATALDASHPAVETLLFRARRAVAASLTHSVGRARRVPVRSALSALVPLSSGYSSLKAALTGGAGVIKASFAVGIGATVPLVLFGALEAGLEQPAGPRTPPAAIATVGPETSVETVMAELGPRTPRRAAEKEPRTAAPQRRSEAKPRKDPAPAPGGGGEGPAQTAQPGTPDQPTAEDPTPSVPVPDTETPKPPSPPEAPAEPANVLICHVTGAKKKPAVTISVAAAAVDYHLAHGDQLGPCPG
jgi:RNA polymerase sigma-70 factor (ECF subfamily)